ncbi:MAG: hypothetical protein ABFS18_14625 [Thermodesulfobacteriota bacterium]
MAKIIRFDPSRRQQERAVAATSCDHKNVVAFTASRTVQCAACGAELDPFDVMLELLKGSKPPGDKHRELKLYKRELERRDQDKGRKRK